MMLLHMLEEKPGLEVDASEGNPFGEEVEHKVRRLLTLCDEYYGPCMFVCTPY